MKKNSMKNKRTTRNMNPNEKKYIQTKSFTRNCNFKRSNTPKSAPHNSIIFIRFHGLCNPIHRLGLCCIHQRLFPRSVSIRFNSNSDFLFVSKLVFPIPPQLEMIDK